MKELLTIAGIILAVFTTASVLFGNVYYVLRSKNYKIAKEELEHCGAQHQESQSQINELKHDISNLQGQITVLKDIPLQEIRDGIRDLKEHSKDSSANNKKVAITNGKILDTLRHSAVDLRAEDNARKTAVRTVKTDLKGA